MTIIVLLCVARVSCMLHVFTCCVIDVLYLCFYDAWSVACVRGHATRLPLSNSA